MLYYIFKLRILGASTSLLFHCYTTTQSFQVDSRGKQTHDLLPLPACWFKTRSELVYAGMQAPPHKGWVVDSEIRSLCGLLPQTKCPDLGLLLFTARLVLLNFKVCGVVPKKEKKNTSSSVNYYSLWARDIKATKCKIISDPVFSSLPKSTQQLKGMTHIPLKPYHSTLKLRI